LKSVTILPLAEAELRDATAWYRDRDPRVADRFTAEARKTLELIERFPQIGGRVANLENDASIRQMPIHTFPYQVVFVRLADRLEVVAFAHNRRKPAYFVARLRRP
jgi:plasmid stabilization system protein ParE